MELDVCTNLTRSSHIFFNTGVIFYCLRVDRNLGFVRELLKLEKRKPANLSPFSLITLVGMFLSWIAFAESRFKIFFDIVFLFIHWKPRRRFLFSIAYLYLHEHNMVISIFYYRFRNRNSTVFWNDIAVGLIYDFDINGNIWKRVFRTGAILYFLFRTTLPD